MLKSIPQGPNSESATPKEDTKVKSGLTSATTINENIKVEKKSEGFPSGRVCSSGTVEHDTKQESKLEKTLNRLKIQRFAGIGTSSKVTDLLKNKISDLSRKELFMKQQTHSNDRLTKIQDVFVSGRPNQHHKINIAAIKESLLKGQQLKLLGRLSRNGSASKATSKPNQKSTSGTTKSYLRPAQDPKALSVHFESVEKHKRYDSNHIFKAISSERDSLQSNKFKEGSHMYTVKRTASKHHDADEKERAMEAQPIRTQTNYSNKQTEVDCNPKQKCPEEQSKDSQKVRPLFPIQHEEVVRNHPFSHPAKIGAGSSLLVSANHRKVRPFGNTFSDKLRFSDTKPTVVSGSSKFGFERLKDKLNPK